jgi:hypothetical protein
MKQKPSSKRRRTGTKSILRLPDLEHAVAKVSNSLNSLDAKRGCGHAIDEFVDWYCSEPRSASMGSWFCAIARLWNPGNSRPARLICVLAPCAGSPTKLATAVFLAPG